MRLSLGVSTRPESDTEDQVYYFTVIGCNLLSQVVSEQTLTNCWLVCFPDLRTECVDSVATGQGFLWVTSPHLGF